MTLILFFLFFSEHRKVHIDTKNAKKKDRKKSVVFSIIEFKLGTVNFLHYYDNARSFQSTFKQAVLKSHI